MKIARSPIEKRTYRDGTVFDSKSEMRRYDDLLKMQAAGLISDLQRQVKFPLIINGKPVLIRSEGYPNGREAIYTADYSYCEPASGPLIIEEHKGVQTDIGRLRIAVAEAIYGFRVRLTGAAHIVKRRDHRHGAPLGKRRIKAGMDLFR